MRIVIAASCLLLFAAEAHAIKRYTSTSMTCAQVQAIISREGAAIMQHRSPRTGVVLYDRYVRSRQYCAGEETTDWTSIPASDRNCRVYRCKQIEFFDYR
jgi:hypothetical protein